MEEVLLVTTSISFIICDPTLRKRELSQIMLEIDGRVSYWAATIRRILLVIDWAALSVGETEGYSFSCLDGVVLFFFFSILLVMYGRHHRLHERSECFFPIHRPSFFKAYRGAVVWSSHTSP